MEEKAEKKTLGATVIGLASAAALYTCWGILAGFIYILLAPDLGLPQPGVMTIIGLWWLWFFATAPLIVFAVSLFRVTEPLKKALEE